MTAQKSNIKQARRSGGKSKGSDRENEAIQAEKKD